MDISELAIYLNKTNPENAETLIYHRLKTNLNKVVIPVPNVSQIQRYKFVQNKIIFEDFYGNENSIKIFQKLEENKITKKRNVNQSFLYYFY